MTDDIMARPDGTGSRASTEPASGLGPSGFDPSREIALTVGEESPDTPTSVDELDLSWVDIAVDWKRNVSVIAFSAGFAEMAPEHHWEDMFDTYPPEHLEPGAYRWSGFTVGYSGEDDGINARGGFFRRYTSTPAS